VSRALQEELNNWTTNIKFWVNFTNNLPTGILDDMLGQVEKDNSFLNKPTLKQVPITDGEWHLSIIRWFDLHLLIVRHEGKLTKA